MKKLDSILVVSLFFVSTDLVFAAGFKSEKAVHAEFFSSENPARVEVKVDKGFHLNEQAPNKVTLLPEKKVIKPARLEKQKMTFDLPEKFEKNREITLAAYVCDDAVTVCEQRNWTWPLGSQSLRQKAAAIINERTEFKNSLKQKNGFWINNLDAALSECKTANKPVLMVFSARWCPGCMRMEKEIWTAKSMKKTLNDFSRVKMDADLFQTREVMDQYGVAAIPTMLILNCEGDELERFVDYQPKESFQKSLQLVRSTDLPSKSSLIAKAEKGDVPSARILAKRYAMAYKVKEALDWYAKVPDREKDLDYWRVSLVSLEEKAENEKGKKAYAQALQTAVDKFGETPSGLEWRLELGDLKGASTPEGKKVLEDLVKYCSGLIEDPAWFKNFSALEPAGDSQGFEILQVYRIKGEALEKLESKDLAQQNWKEAVAQGKKLKIKDEASGPYFRFLPILVKAGEKKRVNDFFAKSLSKKPKDGELNRRYARFLFDEGKFQQAADVSKRALADSYDQNEIFAAVLHAKALNKLGQKEEAKKFLMAYQAREDLPEKNRKELQKTIEGF